MNFELQRFAVADSDDGWKFEEISTNSWKATWGETTVIITGVSNCSASQANALWVSPIGELKDVTYTNTCDEDIDIYIGDETYTMKAGVTNGKFVQELPEFGLMSKADKLKLDRIPTDFSNFITGGEMTANGFVLTNSAGEGVVTIPAQV